MNWKNKSIGISTQQQTQVRIESSSFLLEKINKYIVVVVGEDYWHDIADVSANDVFTIILKKVESEVAHHVDAAKLGFAEGDDDKAGFSLLGHYLQSTLQYWTSCLSLSR